jgi:dTDP-glucose 4,6-dehydratase
MTPPSWTLGADLDAVLAQAAPVWPALRGARLFITGGTGFIGRWLLETLHHADRAHQLGVHVTVLTRDPAAFAAKAPHLAAWPGLQLVAGDVGHFAFPDGEFSHVIHAATDASAYLNEHNPAQMFATVLDGTRRVLEFCAARQVPRTLFLSSGAVYGPQPPELERVAETYRGGPDCLDARATYAEAKRAAETLCAIYAKQHGCQISVARIFAAVGPFLPLDTHFAIGNFIRDAIAGTPIVIQGDGRALRSYLYASDLAAWLWRMLVQAPAGRAFNVGSDHAVSIRDLAAAVSTTLGGPGYEVLGASDSGWNPGRYIPDITAAREELGVQQTVPLDEAIRRTALWNGWSYAS